ncbi:hypothetical protein [Catenuloplanes atrovinosus]|uniref:Uncharacterized protein n=1 Tax=Catenuloplanes atrovinosus TaxID=137266 RepID=A0AAE4CF79_9ACTN|nr:hypothetical protein [Catenuloplanes atrovinosus]MDR7280769.1 hypothetical protein [Catenuloplanes atrovinosus]
MAIPDDDLGPAWLRDYGRIEADIEAMSAFARALIAEIQDNYVPHATRVIADMEAEHPRPAGDFREHARFLAEHETAMRAATDNVYWYVQAGNRLGNAAAEISTRYADADAFSAAQTHDVREALEASGATEAR